MKLSCVTGFYLEPGDGCDTFFQLRLVVITAEDHQEVVALPKVNGV